MEKKNTGVVVIQGYRSTLSNEIFLSEKEALQKDSAIRNTFSPQVITKYLDEYLSKELKMSFAKEIEVAKKSKNKARYTNLLDLQEIVYNQSNRQKNNAYFSKSPMEIAVDLEILFGTMSEIANYTEEGYYDNEQISKLYSASQKEDDDRDDDKGEDKEDDKVEEPDKK